MAAIRATRAGAVLLLCLSVLGATPAVAQTFEVTDIVPSRGPESAATDAVVSGEGLSAGTQITLIGSSANYETTFPTGGSASFAQTPLVVRDGLAYLANLDLKIFDLSDPVSPVLLGSLDIFGTAIALSGDTLSVASGNVLYRVDVSDPAAPTLIGTSSAPVSCRAMDAATLGPVAYIACGWGLLVWDDGVFVRSVITDSRALFYQDVDVADGHAYVTGGESGLNIFDLNDPTDPAKIGELPAGAFVGATAMTIDGDTAWLGGGDRQVVAVDVTDRTAPFIRGRAPHYIFPVGMAHADGVLFAMSVRQGPQLYDIRDIDHPRLLYTTYAERFFLGYGIATTGAHMYAVDAFSGALEIFDVASPVPPGLGKGMSFLTPGLWDGGPARSPGLLHVILNDQLVLLDVMPDGSYGERGSIDVGRFGRVINAGGLDYVLNDESVLAVDVGNPDAPMIIGQLPVLEGRGLAATGDLLFVTTDDEVLLIDIDDPTRPTLIGELNVSTRSLTASNSLLAVSTTSGTIEVYDLGDPLVPELAATVPLVASDLEFEGSTLFVAAEQDGLQILDLSSPFSPAPVGEYGAPLNAFGVALDGSTVRVSAQLDGEFSSLGQYVFDIDDPSAPRLAGGQSRISANVTDSGYAHAFTDNKSLQAWRVNPLTSASGLSGSSSTLSIPAGMSPGLYDVVALGPGGEFSFLRRGFEVLADSDGDGVPDNEDCDPDDPDVYPGAVELPGNTIDEDCDDVTLCDPQDGWATPGQFVSCVARSCAALTRGGHVTSRDCADLVSKAVRSGN